MPNNYRTTSSGESSDEDGGQYKWERSSGYKYELPIITRPNASAGYWLACLLPLAFLVQYLQPAQQQFSPEHNYHMLTIAAVGMCIESLCFFMYLSRDTGLLIKLLISFVPGLFTSCLIMYMMQESVYSSFFWGFVVTFCYQNAYIRVIRGLPCCFSYGEAAVFVQGLMLFAFNMIYQVPAMIDFRNGPSILNEQQLIRVDAEFRLFNYILMFALFCLVIACWLLTKFSWLRHPVGFYILMIALLVTVTCTPITEPMPLLSLYLFLIASAARLKLIFFYFLLVIATVGAISWQLQSSQHASTRVRKVFHLLIVLVYVPGVMTQCTFLYLASGVAFAVLTVFELFRVLSIPPLALTLKNAFTAFCDGKDAGMLALTPFCLLIGCTVPIWIHPCPCDCSSIKQSITSARLLPLLAGVWTIGFGDTAASIIGSKFGCHRWTNSQRTVEGTVAFVLTVLGAICLFWVCGVIPMSCSKWCATLLAILVSAAIEAKTDQIDNLVLPLVFYIIVNLDFTSISI